MPIQGLASPHCTGRSTVSSSPKAPRALHAVAAAASRHSHGKSSAIGHFRPGLKESGTSTKTGGDDSDDEADGEKDATFFLGSSATNIPRPKPVHVAEPKMLPKATLPAENEVNLWQQGVLAFLGLRPNATCWGRENYDWGIRNKVGKLQEEWYAASPMKQQHETPTWWSTPWHRVPHVRHLWGEAQYELHPGAQELFLDLIFVGVAFRIGSVLKAAFYLCTPADAPDASDGHDYAEHECLGLPLGLAHSLAPFTCMYMLWLIETSFRAKFNGWSKVHSVLDSLGNLMLLIAGMNMGPAHEYRGQPKSVKLTGVLVPLMGSLALWTLRTLEMALLGRRECARRQSSGEVLHYLQVMLLWTGALILSRIDFSHHGSFTNDNASDAAAGLMWSGVVWWMWRRASGPLSRLHLPGTHLPLERTAVCNNMGFIAHRNNEFMFLMLGEAVLQIIVSDGNAKGQSSVAASNDIAASLFNATSATATAGLTLALAMMFSFRQMVVIQLGDYKKANQRTKERATQADSLLAAIRKSTRRMSIARKTSSIWASRGRSPPRSNPISPSLGSNAACRSTARSLSTCNLANNLQAQPPHPEGMQDPIDAPMSEKRAQRLLLHMRAANVVSTLLFTTNALAVLLVGVGIKLAIIDPTASVDAHFALQQRLELGVPCTVVFSIQLLNTLLKHSHHYKDLSALCAHPAHLLLIVVRIALLATKVFVCFIRLQPVVLLAVEAALAMAQCALLHIQEHRVRIVSPQHPLSAQLPDALNTLREKAKLHRDMQRSKLGDRIRASARLSAARQWSANDGAVDLPGGLQSGGSPGKKGGPDDGAKTDTVPRGASPIEC